MGLCERLDVCFDFRYRRWISIVIAILELFWFGGYHYGFNSLVPAYKSLGVFAYNCTQDGCLYKDDMFGNAFIVWVVTQMCLVTLAGVIMDKVGLRALKLISVSMYFVGTLFFAFTKGSTSGLIFAAGILVAVGSTSSLICNHQISSMFPNYRGLCISLMSGAFDSSTFIAYCLSITYHNVSLQTSFIIIACVSLAVGLVVALLILTAKSTDMCRFDGRFDVQNSGDQKLPEEEQLNRDQDKNKPVTDDFTEEINVALEDRYPTLKKCILSWPFFLVTLWFVFGLLRFSYFLGQLYAQLKYQFPNDSPLIEHLLQVSSAFSMCGLLAAPISGFILDSSQAYFHRQLPRIAEKSKGSRQKRIYFTHIRGMAIGFMVMAVFAVAMSLLILIPNKIAFYFAFLCLVVVRSLLFSASVSFCLIAFPIKYFGTVNGFVNTIGGMFSLLQYALLQAEGNVGNYIAAVAAFGLFISPIALLRMGR